MLSRVIGYVREAYIAYAFGAGPQTDAYVAAFTLPDWLNYIVAGGAASITFISIYTRFLAEKRDADAKKTFSVVITVMTAVMIAGTIVTEIFTPQFVRWMFHGFSPAQVELTVHSDPHSAAGADFFLRGRSGFGGFAVAPSVSFPAFGPLLYNVFIIVGGVIGGAPFGDCFAGVWRAGGERCRAVSGERDRRGAHWDGISSVVRRDAIPRFASG